MCFSPNQIIAYLSECANGTATVWTWNSKTYFICSFTDLYSSMSLTSFSQPNANHIIHYAYVNRLSVIGSASHQHKEQCCIYDRHGLAQTLNLEHVWHKKYHFSWPDSKFISCNFIYIIHFCNCITKLALVRLTSYNDDKGRVKKTWPSR